MTAALASWLAGLLGHALWLGLLGAIPSALGTRFARRSPRLRHDLAGAGLLLIALGMATLAVLTYPRTAPQPTAVVAAPLPMTAPVQPAVTRAGTAGTAAGGTRSPTSSWSELIVGCWLAGVALLSLRHGLGWWRVRGLRRRALPGPEALAGTLAALAQRLGLAPPELKLSAEICSPAVLGWWRPLVLLPAGLLTRLSPTQIEALLLHELAHLRRRDWRIAAAVAGLEVLLFFHPAVWWLGRTLRQAREECCDSLAVAAGAGPRTLAEALVSLAEDLAAPRPSLAAASGDLAARIARLLDLPLPRSGGGHGPALAGALVLAGSLSLLAIAADQPTASEPPRASTLNPTTGDFTPLSVNDRVKWPDSITEFLSPAARLAGRSAPVIEISIQVLSGPDASIAALQTEVAPRRHSRADIATWMAAHPDLAVEAQPSVRLGSADVAQIGVSKQTAYISDYAIREGQPDPVISVLSFGTMSSVAASVDGERVRIHHMHCISCTVAGVETGVFTWPFGNENRRYPLEEPVMRYRSNPPLTEPLLLGQDEVLAIPLAELRLDRATAQIRARVQVEPHPESTPLPAPTAEPALLLLVQALVVPGSTRTPASFITLSDPAARLWLDSHIDLSLRDAPLTEALAALAARSAAPLWIAEVPVADDFRVTLDLQHATWQQALEQLLQQSLLYAEVGPAGIHLLTRQPIAGERDPAWHWKPGGHQAAAPQVLRLYDLGDYGLAAQAAWLAQAVPQIYAGSWSADCGAELRGGTLYLSAPAGVHADWQRRLAGLR